jgi:predicted double-glycine peptidase
MKVGKSLSWWMVGLVAAGASVGLLAGMPARGAQLQISGPIAGLPGLSPQMPVQSFQARRFNAVIPQEFDYSCGSAALATLLTYSYDMPVTEMTVFRSMIKNGDKAVIEQSGFSLLDMKLYLQRQGLPSGGFRAPLSTLASVRLPAIVLINVAGYRHFVVVTGIRDGRVLLADPAVGIRSVAQAAFAKQWSGIFFLVLDHVTEARAGFDQERNWANAPAPPVGLARFMVDLSTLRETSAMNLAIF